ncbi:hypothetical protein AVEN_225347-1 [Araneus ventricosus]|uniref:PiggyBac transposable element-derived protein domain-containing protein n=1 Tax=Araneus ventricosus TaxID=182803 RepID=A0A4Y2ALH6_ARAVE|nr:hypothetical protein AVEN_225347-1 [Araneus ventricosus]
MPRKFLTAQETLNFLWALDDIDDEFFAGKSPVELFELICLKLIELTVEESIKYSKQKNNHVFEISMAEMKLFLGILFYSGYHILPQEKMYWENAPDIGTLILNKAMSKNRYYEIKKYLHFDDNLQLGLSARYFKVRQTKLFNNLEYFLNL